MSRECVTCKHWTKRRDSDNGDCAMAAERGARFKWTTPDAHCRRYESERRAPPPLKEKVTRRDRAKQIREIAYLHEKRREDAETIAILKKQLREKRNEVVRLRTALLKGTPRKPQF